MSETYNMEEAAKANKVAFAVTDDDTDDHYQHEDDETASSGTRTGCCYRTCVRIGCRCFARLPERWPRTFALWMGVVFPLFLLIAVSCLFGYGLARLEAPGEVEANDAIIATRAAYAFAGDFVTNLTKRLPHICLSVYFAQNGLGDEILNQTMIANSNLTLTTSGNSTHGSGKDGYLENLQLEEAIDMVFVRQYSSRVVNLDEDGISVPLDDAEVVNTTDLMLYMYGCGAEGLNLVSRYDISKAVDTSLIGADLSFNWMRCDGDNSTGFKGFLGNVFGNRNQTIFQPGYQEQLVIDQWRQNQQELYRQYFDQYYNMDGKRRFEARWLALQDSFEQAKGHLGCDMNWYAGAWFWFTIVSMLCVFSRSIHTSTSTAGRGEYDIMCWFLTIFFSLLLFWYTSR